MLMLFQLVLLSNFCLTGNGAGSHLRYVSIVLTLGLIQSIYGSALVLMLKQMDVEGILGNACHR